MQQEDGLTLLSLGKHFPCLCQNDELQPGCGSPEISLHPFKRYRDMKRLVLLAGIASMLLLGSCGAGHNHEEHHESEEYVDGHGHEADPHDHDAVHGSGDMSAKGHADEIVISPEKAAAAGIATETVAPGSFAGIIRTGGRVMLSKSDERTVVASTDGIVSFSGNYFEGASVEEGQPLFSVISGAIQDGNRIGKARIAYETAKAEYERASALVDSKIVSKKEFVRIKEDYENARLAYEALRPNADGTGVVITAPFRGYVESIFVKDGDYVQMGAPLACITMNTDLVLQADVSQRYYDRLQDIVSANFMTPSMASVQNVSDLGGRLLSIGRSSAGSSYYIPVTFSFANNGKIVPGTFAEVWLMTRARDNVLSLPVSAITEEQGLYFVYLRLDDSCYKKQEVTLGESDGQRTEILSGIRPGDNVVVRGAYNVRLASASNIIPAHTHNH